MPESWSKSKNPGSGLYKGSASVDHADISGRFEGDLTVHGQLTLRATGRLVGSLRYAQMEIESGGRISGTMEEIEPSASAKKPATTWAKPAAAMRTELMITARRASRW